jgi:hypothetical protein
MSGSLGTARERLPGHRTSIVPYCHPDRAWTHTRHWYEMRCVLVVDEVLDILDEQDGAGVPPDAPHAFRWYMDVFCTQFESFRRAGRRRRGKRAHMSTDLGLWAQLA